MIRKIDRYIVRSFMTYFFMTFFISMLILLIQFTWQHISDLIGKGVSVSVIGEFFLYTSANITPLALPLAILLASLMTFGNLGEYFELTAMKSAGISLWRIMRSLIIFLSLLSIGAFFFSNNVLPISQTKLWTLIFSLREKSPAFDIPEGEFYSGIKNINLYVSNKNPNKKQLQELYIYDFTNGFKNAVITLADSGKVEFTADNKHLRFTLFNGESFENLKQEGARTRGHSKSIPYRRETFGKKVLLIDFDNEFNRYDESVMADQYVSKNVFQLTRSVDSLQHLIAAKEQDQSNELVAKSTFGGRERYVQLSSDTTDISLDSLFTQLSYNKMKRAVEIAKRNAKSMMDDVEYNKIMLESPTYNKRKHEIEWHRKFTLSFACLIFFFIGAPLGAIIRKGGLGMPLVISVLLFIVYYIIDTTGWKMAREGFWQVAQGMWLSSAVLLPLGFFLTWKAVTDADMFRTELYEKAFDKMKGYYRQLVTKKTKKHQEEF